MNKKKKDKRQKIPFSKYTKGGRISSLMSVASVIIFILAVCISIAQKGNAGIIVGILGLLTFIISVAGFIVGILSFKEETKFLRYSWTGTISNLFIWLIMFMMLLIYR